MRRAGQAASEILEKVAVYIRPGVLTRDVDRHAAELIAEAGCKSAFPELPRLPPGNTLHLGQ